MLLLELNQGRFCGRGLRQLLFRNIDYMSHFELEPYFKFTLYASNHYYTYENIFYIINLKKISLFQKYSLEYTYLYKTHLMVNLSVNFHFPQLAGENKNEKDDDVLLEELGGYYWKYF